MQLTEGNPLSQVALLGARWPSHESLLELLAKVGYHPVHRRLYRQDTPDRVVLDNRSLHSGVLQLIRRAKHVVDNLAIDKRTVVVIHLGLVTVLASHDRTYQVPSTELTLSHFPSVAYIVLINSG